MASIASTNTPDTDARPVVDALLAQALAAGASDLHIEPMADACEARLRVDGLLSAFARYSPEMGRTIVSRLMVMAQLLSYRQDVPQEGRIEWKATEKSENVALRVSIMPTTHGLRAAVRLPAELQQPRTLRNLGLPPAVLAALENFALADSGMLLLTGPAGSGKTTTIYALLDHIAQASKGISIVALEDPVERDLPGVTQIQVSPFGQLTYERAIKSILRQDPQVMMLGEIRDAATASLAVQAALSGHRMISTLHAGTPAGAIARLLEMGLAPYQITASLFGVVSMRLLRKREGETYRGRVPIAELGLVDEASRQAILKHDVEGIAAAFARQAGHQSLRKCSEELIAGNITDAPEVLRILGPESK
jgi:general secretion pathway protein E